MSYLARNKKTGLVTVWRSIREGSRVRKVYVGYVGTNPTIDQVLGACSQFGATPPKWIPLKHRREWLREQEYWNKIDDHDSGVTEAIHRICEPTLNELEAMHREKLRTKKSIEIAKVQQEIEEHTFGRRRR